MFDKNRPVPSITQKKFVIVGASFTGIQAWHQLVKQGISPDDILICDRGRRTRDAVGGGLNLRPPTANWFEAQGIKLDEIAFNSPRLRVITKQPTPQSLPYGDTGMFFHHAPGPQQRQATTWSIAHNRLVELLPPGTIKFGNTVTGVDINGDRPIVMFKNRDPIKAEIVIAADGRVSTVRESTQTPENVERLGYVAIRAVVPTTGLSADELKLFFDADNPHYATVTNFVGDNCRFFMVPVPGADMRNGNIRPPMLNINFFLKVPDGPSYNFLFGANGKPTNKGGFVPEHGMGSDQKDAIQFIAARSLPRVFQALLLDADFYASDVRMGGLPDLHVPGTGRRIIRIGDAAGILPPNTGMGANNGWERTMEVTEALGAFYAYGQTPDFELLYPAIHQRDIKHVMRTTGLGRTIKELGFLSPQSEDSFMNDPFHDFVVENDFARDLEAGLTPPFFPRQLPN